VKLGDVQFLDVRHVEMDTQKASKSAAVRRAFGMPACLTRP
jgi:hypothetical protein